MVKTKDCPADDHGIAIVTAALLRRGQMLHHISLILSTLVLAQLAWQGVHQGGAIEKTCPWMQAVALLFGIAELWFAARVALDADLFGAIAEAKLDVVGLDKALTRLTRKTRNSERGMNDRSQGSIRLLRLQGYCLLGQIAAFFSTILLAQYLI